MAARALYGKQDIRPFPFELSEPEGQSLLLNIIACGICGSDVRMYYQGPTPRYDIPIILGHEIVGKVSQVGPDEDRLKPGDIVTIAPIIPCLRCSLCLEGKDNLCENGQVIGCTIHGGFTEQMMVPAEMVRAGGVVKIPKGIDPITASLTETLSCCYHGLKQVDVHPGCRALIIGDGPIGLSFLQLLKLRGAGYIATSGRRSSRRELSESLGAHTALDAKAVELKEYFDDQFDIVIVATSNTAVLGDALALTRPGGDLLLFSGYPYGTLMELDVNRIHYGEIHLHGSIDATIDDFSRAAALLPQLEMHRLISAEFPLTDIDEGFRTAKEEDVCKVLIKP